MYTYILVPTLPTKSKTLPVLYSCHSLAVWNSNLQLIPRDTSCEDGETRRARGSMCGGEEAEGGQGEEEVLEALGALPERASMGHRYERRKVRMA